MAMQEEGPQIKRGQADEIKTINKRIDDLMKLMMEVKMKPQGVYHFQQWDDNRSRPSRSDNWSFNGPNRSDNRPFNGPRAGNDTRFQAPRNRGQSYVERPGDKIIRLKNADGTFKQRQWSEKFPMHPGNMDYCYYHQRWGHLAMRCVENPNHPCKFPKNGGVAPST